MPLNVRVHPDVSGEGVSLAKDSFRNRLPHERFGAITAIAPIWLAKVVTGVSSAVGGVCGARCFINVSGEEVRLAPENDPLEFGERLGEVCNCRLLP